MLSYVEEKGIRPTSLCAIYHFEEEELKSLVSSYIEKEIGMSLDVKVEWYQDGSADISLDESVIYDMEMEEEQAEKLFVNWNVESEGTYSILSDMFGHRRGNISYEYNMKEEMYEISLCEQKEKRR